MSGMIAELMNRARIAQKEYESFSQTQVDAIVKAIGKVVYERAEELAKLAVEETKMGVYEDKVAKNKNKAKIIWNNIKDKKSVGIIEEDKAIGIIKVAKPKGIIASVTPCTNPVVTPMCNAMFALKGRNAVIILPHPKAKKVTKYLVELFNEEITKLKAPKYLIQSINEPSTELREELMKSVDTIIATGGAGTVKAAYSSGKPAYGVGPGNVQCIIDRNIDISKAVPKIITGRIFDNGIICSSEQSIIISREQYSIIMDEFCKNGAYIIEDDHTIKKLANILFPDNIKNNKTIGQSVQTIANLAGIRIPDNIKVLVVKARGIGKTDVLCREKMCPVLTAIPYDTFEEAIDIAQANLDYEGKGHSCSLHSDNMEHIQYAGEKLTVSRLIINQPSSTNTGGSLYNGFAPTTTLGCGSWGNNSISENLDYIHLINISRIGLFNKNAKIPTDEEIWT